MGYTKVPNELLEIFMNDLLTDADRKILAVVIRKTLGFHKQWDLISFSQFETLTGLSRQSVSESTTRLVNQGLLLKRTGNAKRPNGWAIADQLINTLGSQPRLTSQAGVVTGSRHTKEKTKNERFIENREESVGGDITNSTEDIMRVANKLSQEFYAKEGINY